MSRILDYILNSVPYMLCSVPFVILIRIILHFIRKERTNWLHELGLLLFIMFAIGVASQTVIPKIEFGNTSSYIINGNLLGEVNLIPGMVFADTYRECIINGYWIYFAINFIGNICLFLPIGFGMALLWNKMSFKKVILVAFLCSLAIELCQLPQARGTDIDDLWINTLGAALGYLLYQLLVKIRVLYRLFLKFKLLSD